MRGHGGLVWGTHLGAGEIQIKLENALCLELIGFAYGYECLGQGWVKERNQG